MFLFGGPLSDALWGLRLRRRARLMTLWPVLVETEDFGMVVGDAKRLEEGGIGGDLGLPGVGEQEAMVLLVEGGELVGCLVIKFK